MVPETMLYLHDLYSNVCGCLPGDKRFGCVSIPRISKSKLLEMKNIQYHAYSRLKGIPVTAIL